KNVKINDINLMAIIDTGSDLSLMREEQYVKLGAPNLTRREIMFRGISAENYKTIGQFNIEIEIDGECFTISLSVVPNNLMRYDLLLGTDFLDRVNLYVEEG
ncbi:hypothetical protein EAG_11946, partial [Camponotus floridanus]